MYIKKYFRFFFFIVAVNNDAYVDSFINALFSRGSIKYQIEIFWNFKAYIAH